MTATALKHRSKPLRFYNSIHSNMTFEQVFKNLSNFIKQAPCNTYRLSIGTDSQVNKHTVFITAIHLHRVGRGAIGFITKQVLRRPIRSLREKIYYETSKTLEISSYFTPERIDNLIDSILKSKDNPGDIRFEFHLDVGTHGPTKELISEMVAMASATIFEPKIKPESYAASSYANRYTKHSRVNSVK